MLERFANLYPTVRTRLFERLCAANPSERSPAKPRGRVASTQRLLDHWVGVCHCVDLGLRPNLVLDKLIELRAGSAYAPEGPEAWMQLEAEIAAIHGRDWLQRSPELADLSVPNHVLCDDGPAGLLALAAEQAGLSLADLSGVWERSVAGLDRLRAHAEGRPSGDAQGKRKRDGVYYTPEWIARHLVDETLGVRLLELRGELGLDSHASTTTEPKRAAALRRYAEQLDAIKLVDPACGAGALLIPAFELLFEQRREVAVELGRFDPQDAAEAILADNLHGVDLDPDAVAFTRLMLSLRAARHGLPLSRGRGRDQLRCGNALVSGVFEWERVFPQVWDRAASGFDCVIGNPPYVKLQEFRARAEQRADTLIAGRTATGDPIYESTQTGSFDLCLPFIERGVSLLNRDGKLGYIAPSAWLISAYGEGLRRFIRRTRALDRWIDFEDHQVFPDATTYTALQLFTGRPQLGVRWVAAGRGRTDLAGLDWQAASVIPHASLASAGPWRLMAADKLALCTRLEAECSTLEQVCAQISVGVQTSADHVYHLRRVGPGRYQVGSQTDARELELEDAIMRPLISGPEANRYREPETETYLLFPYVCRGGRATLIPAASMAADYPLAWAYLGEHEPSLRARERRKMDRDDRWWGYNYPKNLSKQELPKLIVAQTVPSLRVAYDASGRHCLNNVRVNGVFTADAEQAWFLLAVLNAPVADFVFRATAKRKAGGYFEANKQYIAPLPIPPVDADQRRVLAAAGERLQALHTQRARATGGRGHLDELTARIEAEERELNAMLFGLYGLDENEVNLVEG